MDKKETFLIEHWEKKSNAILGFVVIQSILLADKLANNEFMTKIKEVNHLKTYMFVAHTIIAVSAVIFLILIDLKLGKKLGIDNELKSDIELRLTLIVKIVLIILFGLIPIFIIKPF